MGYSNVTLTSEQKKQVQDYLSSDVFIIDPKGTVFENLPSEILDKANELKHAHTERENVLKELKKVEQTTTLLGTYFATLLRP